MNEWRSNGEEGEKTDRRPLLWSERKWVMASLASATPRPLPPPSPSSQSSLFLLPPTTTTRRFSSSSSPSRPHLLPIHSLPLASTSSSSSSYNGWADLAAAEPDLPFASRHAPFLLILLPLAATFSLPSRLPLLTAAFTAGFLTARHLAPSTHSPDLLADLDARLLSFRDRFASSSDADIDPDGILLLQALDGARHVLLQCRVATTNNTTAASAASDRVLADVAREAAGYFGAWARDTLRDLSFVSPRKKPKEIVKVAPAAEIDATTSASSQQGDVDKPSESSSVQTNTRHNGVAQDKSFGSAVTESVRLFDMLSFDGKDAHGLEDAGLSAQTTHEDDRMERLAFMHRYRRRDSGVPKDDPFQDGEFTTESIESSLLERTLEIRDRSYRLKIEHHNGGGRRARETRERPADEFMSNAAGADEPVEDEGAAMGSDGEEFSSNIKEAAEILRKARESMMTRANEETADALLYRSARLLSTAVALRPTSLIAVGQLGNTYLLHGELKLKISRELRTLLTNSGAYLNGREHVSKSRKLDRRILSKNNILSALVGVCEECESLLVEAGRSYRMVVSIDSGDVKALYNWGLALTFRAQLLADIGPEAAVDADQVYLAAIDKFDAMLSKSNTYAPEALYRWGSALQQRSQLRSRNNKEKIRLLEQAKSLFEDVLYVEADNKMVREALSSCISELNYHGRWL